MSFDERLESLKRAAQIAQGDPFYLAGLMEVYQHMEGMDSSSLARYLGCLPDTLPRVALCRRPDPSPRRFRADVEAIARRFGLKADHLANLVRVTDAFRHFSTSQGAAPLGNLMAARDRQDDDRQASIEPLNSVQEGPVNPKDSEEPQGVVRAHAQERLASGMGAAILGEHRGV